MRPATCPVCGTPYPPEDPSGTLPCPRCRHSAGKVSAEPPTVALPRSQRAPAPEASPADTMPLPSPPRGTAAGAFRSVNIPGYEILEEVGRGGMGVVYKARQLGLNRVVALKMILTSSHADENSRARFLREAEAIARLQHPHIVQVYEVGHWRPVEGGGDELLPFISLEFCSGGSLDEHLDGTPLAPARAAGLVEILARAVQAAHEQQLVHRDLKPANVLLAPARREGESATGGAVSLEKRPQERDPLLEAMAQARRAVARRQGSDPGVHFVSASDSGGSGRGSGGRARSAPPGQSWLPKVTDFGLARRLDEAGQTQSGAILGTPSYMAPEQAGGHKGEVGPAADIYALGAILYECLTGRPPFRAPSAMETILQVTHEEPVPPSRLTPGVPRDLETICLKCLQKDPRKRYPSALALAEDLHRYQEGAAIMARPVGRLERAWRWGRRNPALALTALVALVVGVWGIALHLLQAEEVRRSAEQLAGEHARTLQALEEGRQAEGRALRQVADVNLDRAQQWGERGEVARGLHWLAWGLRVAGEAEAADLEAAYRLNLTAWARSIHALKEVLPHDNETVTVCCHSSDGKLLATGSKEGYVRLWDAQTGRLVGAARKLPAGVGVLAWRPRSGEVAAWCSDGCVRLWEAGVSGPGAVRLELRAQDGPAEALQGALAFSPDGKTLATGGHGARVLLWDVETGKRQGEGLPHGADSAVACFSPDGKGVFTASSDGQGQLWDAGTGKLVGPAFPTGSRATCADFHPDGRRVLTAHEGGAVRVWDARTGEAVGAPLMQGGAVLSAAFSPDGTKVAASGTEPEVHIWDLESRQTIGAPLLLAGPTGCVAFSPDSDRLVMCGQGEARVWEVARPGPEWQVSLPEARAYHLAFPPRGEEVAVGFFAPGSPDPRTRTVLRFQRATGAQLRPGLAVKDHPGVEGLAYSPGGALLYAAAGKGIACWDVHTGRARPALRPPGPEVDFKQVALSYDGAALAALGGKRGWVWKPPSGSAVPTPLALESQPLRAVVFSPDGTQLLAGAGEWTRLWDAGSLKPLGPPVRHPGLDIRAAAFHPDGKVVALAGADRVVRQADAETGAERRPPLEHREAVTGVGYSGDGALVLTTAGARCLLWHAPTGKRVGPALPGSALALDPAGQAVALAGGKKLARWQLPGPAEGSARTVGAWVQVVTGMGMDERGVVRPLPAERWRRAREQARP